MLKAVRVEAARSGRRDSAVIETAVRRDLGLDLLDRLRATTVVAITASPWGCWLLPPWSP